MTKIYLLFSITFLVCFHTIAQDYDFTIIDNSDYDNILKYKVKTCFTYHVINNEEKLDSSLINVGYFNQAGLITKEIDYDFPDTNKSWVLTAQYGADNKIIGEQWIWSKIEVDSTFYHYNEQGQLQSECVTFYFEEGLEETQCDSFYYVNGVRKSNSSAAIYNTDLIEKNDTVYEYYMDGRLKGKIVNGFSIQEFGYNESNELSTLYYVEYNSFGERSKTLVKNPNGKLIKEITRVFDGTLILKIETNNFETKEKSYLSFVYTYY